MVNITESSSPSIKASTDARLLRYQMQSAARYILHNHRVRICMRHQREKYGNVEIFKHRNTSKAFYAGLMVCGSSWVCPLCATKISERRRLELKQAFKVYKQKYNGHMSMLTLTFSHFEGQAISVLLQKLTKATSIFRSGKRYNNIRNNLKIDGSVRALEITYGANGWHPHIHIVNFHRYHLEPHELFDYQEIFYDLWQSALRSVGLNCSWEHGLKLDLADQAAEYISKHGKYEWSAEDEMTKANTKKGRADNLTPFDMLRLVVQEGDLEYDEKFIEYSNAIKNKTQLYWSRGLKRMLDIEEKSDEEVANEKVEEADLLGTLAYYHWNEIIKKEKRHELLTLVEQYGFDEAMKKIGIFP